MITTSPDLIIRVGSHAEKEYALKLARFLDGLIVGANLMEATPGATASLLLRMGAKDTRVYLDPMTYAFGAYVDPESGRVREDLDWIKSDQRRKNEHGDKVDVRDFKRSYKKLAKEFGPPLPDLSAMTAVAVTPANFEDDEVTALFCTTVAKYQSERLVREFQNEEELRAHVGNAPRPSAIFAPYFYLEPNRRDEWLELNLRLMRCTAALGLDVPVHAVLCAEVSQLSDAAFRTRVTREIPETGVAGVWLWFSGLFEEQAELATLEAYRDLVIGLSARVEVNAMHGGFFSLVLAKLGMRGVSHGIGYGEQKAVVPVIGQSTPTVRYYLPPLARRLGVPQMERAFDGLGVTSPEDFFEKVCGCTICRGVVQNSLRGFQQFGETHYSRPGAERRAQTPAAAKRCRFHFLLARIRERDELRSSTTDAVVRSLDEAKQSWGRQPSLQGEAGHLERWATALRNERRGP